MRFFLIAAILAAVACGSDAEGDDAFVPEPGEGSSSGGSSGSLRGDAGAGAPTPDGALASTCDDACRTMSLTIQKGDVVVSFDRAQFGLDETGAYPKLKLAAYDGGDVACPAPTSAQPTHALQLDGVPTPFDGTTFEGVSGITGTLFDFLGDLTASSAVLEAARVDVTPTAGGVDEAGEAFVAFDVRLEFTQGIVAKGHVFATHCASIDKK